MRSSPGSPALWKCSSVPWRTANPNTKKEKRERECRNPECHTWCKPKQEEGRGCGHHRKWRIGSFCILGWELISACTPLGPPSCPVSPGLIKRTWWWRHDSRLPCQSQPLSPRGFPVWQVTSGPRVKGLSSEFSAMIGFQLLRLFFSFSALASVVIGVCASMHLGGADMTNYSACRCQICTFQHFITFSETLSVPATARLCCETGFFLCIQWEWFIQIMLNSHCFQHEILHQKRQVVKCLTSFYWEFSLPPSDLL